MLLEALNTARDLGRLHEIASVLIRHGLGDAVRRLGVANVLRRAGVALRWRGAERIGTRSTQEHVRQALEELGPTFVKVGQILADRSDLLSPAWTDELARLQERATRVPLSEIRAQLEEDLGGAPEDVFASFEPEAVAAASIAQVHRATLRDGTRVALKVRRPGIRETVEADLRLLSRLADVAEREMPELRRFRPRMLVRQLARSLRGEIDLRTEAQNAQRMGRILREHTEIVVPRIFEQWTRERLCVMEFLDGQSLGEWMRGPDRDEEEAKRLARIGADGVLAMVLGEGFFHADPHPGNLLRLPDGRIGLLDFGMVGRLSEARRAEFFELLLAVVESKEDHVVDILLDWSQDGDTDVHLLTQDCGAFVDRYRDVPIQQIDATALLGDVAALLRDNDLLLPGDIALLIKVFVTLDSLGRQLDPEFVTAAHLEPFVRRAARARVSPFSIMRRGLREGRFLMAALPRYTRRILQQVRRGKLKMEIDVRQVESFAQHLDRSANRLTVGMVTAALIIGTSIALSASGGPDAMGLPLFALLGFASSLAAGLWLLWLIFRSGR